MKYPLFTFIVIISMLVQCGCGVDAKRSRIETAEEIISAIEELPNRKEANCDISLETCGREQFTFDVNDYFSILQHLSIQPGYSLDYVYFRIRTGSEPLIYAYPAEDGPFNEYYEFAQAYPGPVNFPDIFDEYLTKIQIDTSPEGFF